MMEVNEFLKNNIDQEQKREDFIQEMKDAKPTKVSSFDLLRNINYTKEWVNVEDKGIDYSQFLVNRTLSYGRDSIMYAQVMNEHPNVDDQMHFDYFINILRKSKRFNKGFDRSKDALIKVIMEYYSYTYQKAIEVLPLLKDDELEYIKNLS